MISDSWLATIFLVVLSTISSVYYLDNIYSVKRFKNAKTIKSMSKFKTIYIFIMLMTLTISPLCFFYNSPLLLKWHSSTFLLYTGLAVASLGMGLFILAKQTLGANYNPCYEAFVPYDIVKTGIYKYVRHPIYSANLLTLTGAFIASGSFWLLPNVCITGFYYYKSSQNEELALSREFPEYLKYLKTSGSFLPKIKIPRHDVSLIPIDNIDQADPRKTNIEGLKFVKIVEKSESICSDDNPV